ncbi:MAG: transcriptional regulator, partial [Brevundimonas sp.]
VLGAALMGSRRFDDFVRTTLLQKTTLSDRLQRLVEDGCLRKTAYSSHASRFEYRLTRKGVELYDIALMTLAWEKRWDARSAARYRVALTHVDCGHETVPVLIDAATDTEVSIDTVRREPGPGEGFVLARHRRRRRQAEGVTLRQSETVFPSRINGIIGDRWSALLLRSMFDGLSRYDELLRDMAVATNILTDRLKTLTEAGLIERSADGDGEYVLTAPGRDTYPIFLIIMRWGDRWCAAPEGPPVVVHQGAARQPVELAIVCSHCHGPLNVANVSFGVVEIDHRAPVSA